MTKYYQCPECGGVTLCAENDIDAQTCYRRENCDGKRMIPVQVTPETQEPWDEIARTLGYEDRHDMQGALAACASYLRYPIAGVEHQHPNQLADELDKAVKAMEPPKIPFHTVNPEEPYDGDLVWTADGRAWAFYAAKHGWNRAPERDRKPTPATPDDEKIERMARAMANRYTLTVWDECTSQTKLKWLVCAKAALAALETPATPNLPEGVMRTYDSSEALGLAGVISCSGRLYNTDASGMLANGYIVDEQYILDCIERDMK